MTGVTIEQLDRVTSASDKDLIIILPQSNPDNICASINIGDLRKAIEQEEITIEDINKILESYPTNQDLKNELSIVQKDLTNSMSEKDTEVLRQAIEKDSKVLRQAIEKDSAVLQAAKDYADSLVKEADAVLTKVVNGGV